jgi:hypothetical protein
MLLSLCTSIFFDDLELLSGYCDFVDNSVKALYVGWFCENYLMPRIVCPTVRGLTNIFSVRFIRLVL